MEADDDVWHLIELQLPCPAAYNAFARKNLRPAPKTDVEDSERIYGCD